MKMNLVNLKIKILIIFVNKIRSSIRNLVIKMDVKYFIKVFNIIDI